MQIGGPAGVHHVIVYGIVEERYGLANRHESPPRWPACCVPAGPVQLGALVRYVPVPIIISFTNGIAVLIGLSRVKDLLGPASAKLPGLLRPIQACSPRAAT